MTFEAFADTIIPGAKRSPDDHAIAGVAPGDGAVAAGAATLLETPAVGLVDALDQLADDLNSHARRYAAEHGIDDQSLPAFVALPFEHRTTLIRQLTARGHPEKELWVLLSLFCNMAFDTGAHLNTAEALRDGHPGLLTMGFAEPDPDGQWRFRQHSYRRQLADRHPDTTPSGSPA